MGAVATFNYQAWKARYPEFNAVPQDLATAYFNEATLYLRNDGSGPVQDAGQQLVLLNMLVSHIARLNALNPDGSSASGLVGPITSATEGSVSVSGGFAGGSAIEAFYAQTPYGFSFWNATAAYRAARYIPSRRTYSTGYGGYGRVW